MHDNSYRSLEKCSASSCCLHAMHATALAVAQFKETQSVKGLHWLLHWVHMKKKKLDANNSSKSKSF